MNWLEIIASTVWHFVFGWAGIDMLIGFAAVAIAVLEPPIVAALIPDLRKWAIAAAVVAFTFTGAIAHGYKLGLDEKQRQWDAALNREAVTGETERVDAERDIGAHDPDRGVFRGDPDNRDRVVEPAGGEPQGPLRRLAPHRIFGK